MPRSAPLALPSSAVAPRSVPPVSSSELSRAIDDKKVKTLFILGGNPVYNAPADLQWSGLQTKVGQRHPPRLCTKTKRRSFATWHVPLAHYLETLGRRPRQDGSYTSVQPMILPLYGGWSEIDLLARLAGLPKPTGPELVQETFRRSPAPAADFITAWTKFLHDGFLAGSAPKDEPLALNAAVAR